MEAVTLWEKMRDVDNVAAVDTVWAVDCVGDVKTVRCVDILGDMALCRLRTLCGRYGHPGGNKRVLSQPALVQSHAALVQPHPILIVQATAYCYREGGGDGSLGSSA